MKEISVEDISFGYDKDNHKCPCLKNISFQIRQGETIGIFGPSGAGKTTLIFLICGLLKPDKGQIRVNGESLSGQRNAWKGFRNKIGMTFQFPDEMFFHESVSEEFLHVLNKKGFSDEKAKALACEALKWAGLDPEAFWSRHPMHLSLGQLRRLSLAIVWVQKQELLILDEPTVGLECRFKKRLLEDMIAYCREDGRMGIIASQDTNTLLSLVDYALILKDGETVLLGSGGKVLSQPDCLTSADLSLPLLADLFIKLKQSGLPGNRIWRDLDEASHDIIEWLKHMESSDESARLS
ncbi:MAG: energy-coupling factor ABC transporter ATP-binding protein [bacterium]